MTNKEKFLELGSDKETDTLKRNRARIQKRNMLRESQIIAMKILNRLDELGWTQKKLAEQIGVTPQQINKIVRGKENLTLETQTELQDEIGEHTSELQSRGQLVCRLLLEKKQLLLIDYS